MSWAIRISWLLLNMWEVGKKISAALTCRRGSLGWKTLIGREVSARLWGAKMDERHILSPLKSAFMVGKLGSQGGGRSTYCTGWRKERLIWAHSPSWSWDGRLWLWQQELEEVSPVAKRVRSQGKMTGGTSLVFSLSSEQGPNLMTTFIVCLHSSVNLSRDPLPILLEVCLPGDSKKKSSK